MVQKTSRYVLAYLLWAISVAVAVTALLSARTSLIIAFGVTQWDRYVEHAINQFGFLFLAIFGLAIIVFTEHFYRTGVEKGRLFMRFFLVSFWEVLILTLVHLAAWRGLAQTATLLGEQIDLSFYAQLVVGEAVVCAILYWLYRRARQVYVKPIL